MAALSRRWPLALGLLCALALVACDDDVPTHDDTFAGTSLLDDPNNCGGCGVACAGSESCSSGVCQ